MPERKSVLHITPHLGGGVGRALSQTAIHRLHGQSGFRDDFLCLESMNDTRYADHIEQSGGQVTVVPDQATAARMVANADIVQIEWWHHPQTLAWMARQKTLEKRLTIWSHVSGLHYPTPSPALLGLPDSFLFSNPCSLDLVVDIARKNVLYDVAWSAGGFDGIPERHRGFGEPTLSFGYLGSLNFSKIHPDFGAFVAAVTVPHFALDIFGDVADNPGLVSGMADLGISDACRFHGFADDPGAALAGMDVFVYLLNPLHYGTAENALLEAMAAGAIPIVLANPCERNIVEDGRTGIVVSSIEEFSNAISFLNTDRKAAEALSRQAAETVRDRFRIDKTVAKLDAIYDAVMAEPVNPKNLAEVIGKTPWQWCLSGAGPFREGLERKQLDAFDDVPFLYERNKGSPLHFHRAFPYDPDLKDMAELLENTFAVRRDAKTGQP